MSGAGVAARVGGRPSLALIWAALAATFVAFAIVEATWGLVSFGWGVVNGGDIAIYLDATARVLGGGDWYLDRQLHGPYAVVLGDVLYPPVTAFAFAPFLVLPLALWWILPAAILAVAVRGLRPAPWTWPLMALCFVWPMTILKILAGNPLMWVTAAAAAGLRWGWPGALVLLKPSLLPFAAIGIRDPRWWAVVAVLAIASLAFLEPTLRYPQVVLDARHQDGWFYSVGDVPLMLVPVIAWIGRRR